ncbi:MAG: hypothetical protein ACD_75C01350G0002 [uncultured bacterium]|nr:MAG: hypothetical protein ACD_75C01350G0002 [uncultured bacterium]
MSESDIAGAKVVAGKMSLPRLYGTCRQERDNEVKI